MVRQCLVGGFLYASAEGVPAQGRTSSRAQRRSLSLRKCRDLGMRACTREKRIRTSCIIHASTPHRRPCEMQSGELITGVSHHQGNTHTRPHGNGTRALSNAPYALGTVALLDNISHTQKAPMNVRTHAHGMHTCKLHLYKGVTARV